MSSYATRSESETREVKSLDGIWNFVKSNQTAPTQGIREKWFLNDLNKVLSLLDRTPYIFCDPSSSTSFLLLLLNQWTLFVFLLSIIARSRHTKQFRCRCRRAIMISPKTMIYANTSAPYGMIANFSCRHRGPITNSFGYASAVCTMRHLWLVFNLIIAFEHLVRASSARVNRDCVRCSHKRLIVQQC